MYLEHRKRFLAELAREGAAAVIPTATTKIRNNDAEYRFRPASDFWYLTGFAEPEAVLVLLPHGKSTDGGTPKGEPETWLFLRERNQREEIWNGRRLGTERAPEQLGVDQARPVDELRVALPGLLAGYARVVYRAGDDAERDREYLAVFAATRHNTRRKGQTPIEIVDPTPILHELRLKKSAGEIACMRRAAELSTEGHLEAMRATQPGVNERELDALLEYTFRRGGGTGCAYSSIVAGGDNACILHYIENDQALVDGELLLIDAGAEFDCYASDVTRTFPVNGRFTPEQRAIYDIVLAAQKAGIEVIAPGVSGDLIHEASLPVLVEGLCELGLLSGTPAEAIESESYKRFYMHGIGHWLGLDVHDCGTYQADDEPRLLEPGMVTTVEPGIYIAGDDETVEARWRGIGVRIEDDILVTESGHENLTEALPKEADEVEAICQGRALQKA